MRREAPGREELRRRLAEQVAAYLDGVPWAPLLRRSRDRRPGVLLRPLVRRLPHAGTGLSPPAGRPPGSGGAAPGRAVEDRPRRISRDGAYPLDRGRRRELFDVPATRLRRVGPPPGPSLGWLDAVALYAELVAGWGIVEQPGVWEGIRAVFEAVDLDTVLPRRAESEPGRPPGPGEAGHPGPGMRRSPRRRARRADRLRARIVEEFRRGAGTMAAESIPGVARIDELIGRGDAVWTRLGGHKSKITLFLGLSPRAAEALAPEVSGPARAYLDVDRPDHADMVPGLGRAAGPLRREFRRLSGQRPGNLRGACPARRARIVAPRSPRTSTSPGARATCSRSRSWRWRSVGRERG